MIARRADATTGINRTFLLAALAILLAGFLLRLSVYDYYGLDGDDGYSLTTVQNNDVPALIDGLMSQRLDIHPPGHFLALKAWISLAGDSLLSLRLMNMLIDVLIGAMMMRLVRSFGLRASLIVGILWLAAPLLIYSGYMIRMYMLLTGLITAEMLCIIEAMRGKHWLLWSAGAALFGLGATYTHIVGFLALLISGAALAISWLWVRQWRKLIGLMWYAIAGVLALPYIGPIWALYRSGRSLGAQVNFVAFPNPYAALIAIMATLLTHRALPGEQAGLIAILFLLVGSGVVFWRWRSKAVPLLALSWLSVVVMLGMAWIAHLYKPYYIVPFAPIMLALVACILALYKRFAAIGIVVIFAISLSGFLIDLDRTQWDDFSAAAAFIQQHEQPGDKIIVVPDYGGGAFQYHYHGPNQVISLFSHVSASINVSDILAFVTKGYERIWLVWYQPDVSDPDKLVDAWLRGHAATITEVYPRGMTVKGYDFSPQVSALPTTAQPMSAQFGDMAAIRGVSIPVTQGSARDNRLHPPSNWVEVTLYLQALRDNVNFTPRIELIDGYGQVYGGAWERDNSLLRRVPASTWKPDQIWRMSYDVNLNPITPPGTYSIVLALLDPAMGLPIPVNSSPDGNVKLGQFIVQ